MGVCIKFNCNFHNKKQLKENKYNSVIEDDDGNRIEVFISKKYIHNNYNRFVVSWWVTE